MSSLVVPTHDFDFAFPLFGLSMDSAGWGVNGSTVGSSLLVTGMLLLVLASGKVRDWLRLGWLDAESLV